MSDISAKTIQPKGYARLSPQLRARLADVAALAAGVVSVIALFAGSHLEGVWLRVPVLLALLLLLPAAWFLYRRKGHTASPWARGGVLAGLGGLSLLAMALLHASGWTALAGLLSMAAALALRGSVAKALVRGRDLKVGERKPLSVLFENIESLASALVLVLLVWHFGLEAFRIPSGSMAPTLLGDPVMGDRVLVDKFTYAWRDPERWEPVVFRYPLRRGEPYVKRCIALPGEQVLIAQGDIYIKRHETAEIELLVKTDRAREVLWLPYVFRLKDKTDWVKHFHRGGSADLVDGAIVLGRDGSATFPRGKDDAPGDAVDHDASFGATEGSKEQFGNHIVGDLRLRARADLSGGKGLEVRLVRDADEYLLVLSEKSARLFHTEQGSDNVREIAIDEVSGVRPGESCSFSYSLADGELVLEVNGEVAARRRVGTALLDQLRARDADSRLALNSAQALAIAKAEPPGGRRGRIVLKAAGEGASVQVLGIDRDVYYIGRTLEEPRSRTELPLGVALAGDQYFVLGDNSPGSADCRYWIRVTLFLNDGTQVTGSLDDPTQPELTSLLKKASVAGDPYNAYAKLFRVAHFTAAERGDDRDQPDARTVQEAFEQFKDAAKSHGRGAIDFWTEGGGKTRVVLKDVDAIQVEAHPYVQRKLFVGRPFAVFLSPRGMKLID
ncbi:MAG: signal peptidase I [Planctomycetes bacterium]|nr:signal peptidase I [Planctomycetota bacterium]MCW8135414.1 signal peptidase I [Planctomycetota bacterium]